MLSIETKHKSPVACENQQFAYAKTKAQTSFAVTAKLISVFVSATQIVQFMLFSNLKFCCLEPSSVLVQLSLCLTLSETQIVGFRMRRLKIHLTMRVHVNNVHYSTCCLLHRSIAMLVVPFMCVFIN